MLPSRLTFLFRILALFLVKIGLWGSPVFAGTLQNAKISEFLASNQDGLEDENGDASDWIELWNTTGVSGDLDGWYLTDNPENLIKWRIPAVEIAAGGRLIVFSSGKDRSDPARELHTNFKLQSEAGGYLALVKPDGVTIGTIFENYPEQYDDTSYGSRSGEPIPQVFIEEGDAARVSVPSGPLPGWQEIGFDDSQWLAVTSGVGFDNLNGGYAELFGDGTSDLSAIMRGKHPTAYIRFPFTVSDASGIDDIVLSARWEDGFIAYLNGVEIHRERAPENAAWNSRSEPQSGRNEEDAVTLFDYPLLTGNVVQGANVLAIHGLNQSTGSSDFLFSPRLTGTKVNPELTFFGYFPDPTPNNANSTRVDGLTADTKFSVDRGLYESGFELEITTITPESEIRFTTDGSPPSETTGSLYRGPITVNETTVVRAIAYRDGFQSTDIDTHTYLFPADVADQAEMNSTVTQHPIYGPQINDALTSIPTISISFDDSDIDYSEIPVSVELLNFESGEKQLDAGAARFGSYYTDFEKRSFRLHFRSAYGPSRLDYPLFEETDYQIAPTDTFDSLDVRAGNHDMIDRGAYLSNRFTDDTMLEMGNLSAHGRFVHIYFNGLYRGQYHLRERWDAAMAADYLPGKEEEFDTINANNSGREFAAPNLQELQDGDLDDWTVMRNLIETSPTPYRAVKDMLDVSNLIDFMLVWTMGNSESEFRAAGSIENGVGFKFFIKDADGYLRQPDGNHEVTHNGPLSALTKFRNEGDPDFKTLLADRIHEHFFNYGALTPGQNIARLQHRIDETQLSYLAEYARRPQIISPGRTRTNRTPEAWLSYQNSVMNNRFPTLTDNKFADLKQAGMYPDLIAPVLSQHGGALALGSGVTMSTDVTNIYYTLDGSDPRLQGGAINPSAINAAFDPSTPVPQDFIITGSVWKYLDDGSDQGSAWSTTAFDDRAWPEGPSQLGYGERDEATTVDFLDTEPETIGFQRNATTYFRHAVTIPNPLSFTHFDLDVLYDDAAAVYLNGVEIARTANLPADAAYDTYATGSTPSESAFERFTLSTSSFISGENIIAVELHNASSGSSDISFDLHLRGEVDAAAGNNFTLPITLNEPAQFRARSYVPDTGEWSALTSTFFSINSTPATAENLVISEIHYHPTEPTSAEEIAVSTNRDDYEFIELLNIGRQPIALSGVHFSDGITFTFSKNSLLNPGERAVLVRDSEAFLTRYGTEIIIAGEYSGGIRNSGERLALSNETLFHELTYADEFPWPAAADGEGFSLVLRNPTSNPDHSLPENWGAHTTIGGGPGIADTIAVTGFEAWKIENNIQSDEADDDQDGLSALVEYALGTSPEIANRGGILTAGVATVNGSRFPTISYPRNANASDIHFQIQSSPDLENWTDESEIELGNETYRTATRVVGSQRHFLRLNIRLK